MAANIIMPQLGLTMTEGTVVKWLKAVGDSVAKGEVIVEITTDKIGGQIEAPLDGTLLAITVGEGNIAPVASTIGVVGISGESVIIEETAALQSLEGNCPEKAPSSANIMAISHPDFIKASPAAKKLARDNNIDLALVTATGPDGRVVERDVKAYLSKVTAKPKTSPLAAKLADEHNIEPSTINKQGRIMSSDILNAASKVIEKSQKSVPLAGIRKIIAERMSLSWHTAPHVTISMAVDMTAAAALKSKLSQNAEKYSFTEIIIKCSAAALKELPIVNASIIDKAIVQHQEINIGVAVALEDGLIVPVIRTADKFSITGLRDSIRDLSTRARNGTLTADEISGGTFTVTNLGMYGVDVFTPVINPPESAILGVCRIQETPVVLNGQICIRPMMNLCLSFDHRLIDGALAAKFLNRVKQLLENPLLLLA
ncbi:dihydrolipoamide acetyltransferase family protein [Dendrosporobacter sp. 1207_IL3150]|uniref:dihydrolipoamide acetyltransferase family protein n=1 Tax=Dendrosporobacter sp. 1207_IL3150 TaxID=3084054 RepID=UPI002FDB1227